MAGIDYDAEIKQLQATMRTVGQVLNLDRMREEIADLSEQVAAPDLWDDVESATRITGRLSALQGELETLARVGGKVCIVVLNDASYGNIRQEQELHFNGRTIGVDFGPVDFGEVARGMGVDGEVVHDLATLTRRAKEALTTGVGPVVLDVPLDRDASAWTYHAFVPYEASEE